MPVCIGQVGDVEKSFGTMKNFWLGGKAVEIRVGSKDWEE